MSENMRWAAGVGVLFAVALVLAWSVNRNEPAAAPAVVAPPALPTVVKVVDGATVELSDGRTIRLGGITVHDPATCGGAEALVRTRALLPVGSVVGGQLTGGTDEHGSWWARLRGPVSDPSSDVGTSLALAGYAEAYQRGADQTYVSYVASYAQSARQAHSGQWGPPCGPAYVAPAGEPADQPTAGSSAAPPDVDIDSGGEDDHRKSRFCRRHWYC